ncbi:MAG: LamG-like jellyroll fold domain-containing protein, partial [Novipirellula sp. JB048]
MPEAKVLAENTSAFGNCLNRTTGGDDKDECDTGCPSSGPAPANALFGGGNSNSGPAVCLSGIQEDKGSIIDNRTLNHIHIARDYSPADRNASSGCLSCGAADISDPANLLDLVIERRHRLRNQSIAGSFGPGVVMNHDIKLEVYRAGDGLHMDLFNPSRLTARRYVDGVQGDVADGVFHDVLNKSIKDAQLLDGDTAADGKATGNPVSELRLAKSVRVTEYSGVQSHYQLLNISPAQPQLTSGQVGSAMQFDGTDDFIAITNPDTLNVSGQVTLSAWIQPEITTHRRYIIARGTPGTPGRTNSFLRIASGTYEIGSWDGSQYHLAQFTIPSGDVGNWVHLTGTYDGTHWRLYRNGIEVASQTSSTGALATARPWSIGANGWGTIGFFKGAIDDPRIYDRGLTPTEVADLHAGNAVSTGLLAHWTLDTQEALDSVGNHHGSLGSINQDRAARITRVNDRRDYATTYSYQSFTPAEIAEAPDRQLQLSSIQDANGRVATFQYHAQQQSGGWVVEQIGLPNGNNIQYNYTDGRLTSVDHPDATQTTITTGSDTQPQTTTVTYDDPAAEGTHRRKTVYLTNNIVGGDGVIFNNSSLLIRMLVNGAGELSYLSLPAPDGDPAKPLFYKGGGELSQLTRGRDSRNYLEGWTLQPTEDGYTINGTLEPMHSRVLGNDSYYSFVTAAYDEVRDDKGVVVHYEYDSDAYPTKKIYSDNSTESWTYNEFKQVLRHRDRLGRVTKKQYNAFGDLTHRAVGILADPADPDNEALDVNQPEYAQYLTTYYPAGHAHQHLKATEQDAAGNIRKFAYNNDHQLSEIQEPDDTGTGFHVAASFTYDTAKRLASSTDALGRSQTFTYDARDRITQVTYDDSSTEQTVYGSPGSNRENLVAFTKDRNGVVSEIQYDNMGRVTLRATAIDSVGPTGSILAAYTPPANYDEGASLTSYQYLDGATQVASTTTDGRGTSYQYDYRMRLVQTTVTPRNGISLVTTRTYRHNQLLSITDPYGRSTYHAYRDSDSALIRTIQTSTPNASSPPTNFTHVMNRVRGGTPTNPEINAHYLIRDLILDAAGQRIADIDPRGVVDAFVYDSRGRTTLQIAAATTLPPYNQG